MHILDFCFSNSLTLSIVKVKKYLLNKLDLLPDPYYVEEFEKTIKKRLVLRIRLFLLKGCIYLGSKDYAM